MSPDNERRDETGISCGGDLKSVLIVDDDDETRQMLQMILRPLGAVIFTARSGSEAIRFTNELNPDAILLDVCMPGMNGFEACARIREKGAAPVIMLTVLDRTEDRVRALNAGAAAYLTKPCPPNVLTAAVQQALSMPSWKLN